MFTGQQQYDIRCEWGEHGVSLLAPSCGAVIIVDVLSFSTSVEIAVGRGAAVFPFPWRDQRADEFARSVGAELASSRRTPGKYSLSPRSLLEIPPGTRLVLPSPNGAALSLSAQPARVLAGCLRNALAVAQAARRYGPKIAVIPAGERWREDNSLRPGFEDLVGAGAIIRHLEGSRSPEAEAALAAFLGVEDRLPELLRRCSSGRELVERGFAGDVDLAASYNVSSAAPVLVEGAYIQAG